MDDEKEKELERLARDFYEQAVLEYCAAWLELKAALANLRVAINKKTL